MKTQPVTEFRNLVTAFVRSGDSIERAVYAAIREAGPVRAARVSSAQAKGRAKGYAYWGAVRYAVKITRDGRLSAVALECAASARRSQRLAEQDCTKLANATDRIDGINIGTVDPRWLARAAGVPVQRDFE